MNKTFLALSLISTAFIFSPAQGMEPHKKPDFREESFKTYLSRYPNIVHLIDDSEESSEDIVIIKKEKKPERAPRRLIVIKDDEESESESGENPGNLHDQNNIDSDVAEAAKGLVQIGIKRPSSNNRDLNQVKRRRIDNEQIHQNHNNADNVNFPQNDNVPNNNMHNHNLVLGPSPMLAQLLSPQNLPPQNFMINTGLFHNGSPVYTLRYSLLLPVNNEMIPVQQVPMHNNAPVYNEMIPMQQVPMHNNTPVHNGMIPVQQMPMYYNAPVHNGIPPMQQMPMHNNTIGVQNIHVHNSPAEYSHFLPPRQNPMNFGNATNIPEIPAPLSASSGLPANNETELPMQRIRNRIQKQKGSMSLSLSQGETDLAGYQRNNPNIPLMTLPELMEWISMPQYSNTYPRKTSIGTDKATIYIDRSIRNDFCGIFNLIKNADAHELIFKILNCVISKYKEKHQNEAFSKDFTVFLIQTRFAIYQDDQTVKFLEECLEIVQTPHCPLNPINIFRNIYNNNIKYNILQLRFPTDLMYLNSHIWHECFVHEKGAAEDYRLLISLRSAPSLCSKLFQYYLLLEQFYQNDGDQKDGDDKFCLNEDIVKKILEPLFFDIYRLQLH